MADARRLPNKKDVARALLLQGSLFVHLDPRREDVIVPAWFKDRAQLVLQVGLDMPVPIPDLRVDDAGVYGTLSFNREAFTCVVPWDAVFAAVGDDGRGMVWPDSMPAEIAAEVEREARRSGHGAIAEVAAAERDKDEHAPTPPGTGAVATTTEVDDDLLLDGVEVIDASDSPKAPARAPRTIDAAKAGNAGVAEGFGGAGTRRG
jgi:hypothetical protein